MLAGSWFIITLMQLGSSNSSCIHSQQKPFEEESSLVRKPQPKCLDFLIPYRKLTTEIDRLSWDIRRIYKEKNPDAPGDFAAKSDKNSMWFITL